MSGLPIIDHGSGDLNVLPNEVLSLILEQLVEKDRRNKNDVLPIRLVCKRFDDILRPKVLKTIQLDFDRISKSGHQAKSAALETAGQHVKCLMLDLSTIRSQSEIKDLRAAFSSVTGRIPGTKQVLEDLNLFCMGENTFDEVDFKHLLNEVFNNVPDVNKLKVCLPFKIVGQVPLHATTLFANLMESIAAHNANANHNDIETLVIGHLSDTTLNKIYGNPIDLKNALNVFKPLIHLVLNIKRQEYDNPSQASFTAGFLRLLREATKLKSLLITGWNCNRVTRQRATQGGSRVERDKWAAQCLPYHGLPDGKMRLMNLQYLELKRVDIDGRGLLAMLFDCSKQLMELYLTQVYLKHDQRGLAAEPFLWVGHGPDHDKATADLWIADEIKKMRDEGVLRLKILRASGLGYDYINLPQGGSNFDLPDPSGADRSFDERFVQRAMGLPVPEIGGAAVSPVTYDVTATQLFHNTTSHYLQTLDGMFSAYNSQALGEIIKVIAAVDGSMKKLTTQLEAVNSAGEGKSPVSIDGDDSDEEEEDDDVVMANAN